MIAETGAIGAVVAGALCVARREVVIETRGGGELHDVTAEAREFVASTAIAEGIVVAQSLHTTAGLIVNEWETGFRHDLSDCAERLIPAGASYRHDDESVRWENLCPEDFSCPNGHAHLQHAVFAAPSVTLCVTDGALLLGVWQRLLLIELDRPRTRVIALQALGGPDPGL